MARVPKRSCLPAGPGVPSVRARGMTLMELMVSIAILAGMILAFNIILSQSQRVVSGTQRSIRANAAGMAISQAIRRDVASVTKNGFLHISPGKMVFTTAGVSESVTGPARGNASLICYQMTGNILCRRGLVLTKSPGKSVDVWSADLADIQAMDSAGVTNIVNSISTSFTAPVVPAQTPAEVRNLWQVLAHNVTSLDIKYATRATPGTWQAAATTWTYRDQDAWPAAVKIRFTLSSQSEVRRALRDVEDPASAVDYEVVCPIGG